jgi:Dolichyl-phosphate-mannose-protein mannosyltransferase
MPALKNSESSRPSSSAGSFFESPAAVACMLAVAGAAVAYWCALHGYTLYYGDAEAHLNIARRILDSRTPNGEQFGTVWLPLPHLLMLPFVQIDALWKSGWAGVIPVLACFVAAGTFLYAAARRCCGPAAGFAAAALFATNPNMLYLASTPMTEPVFAATLAALLWATLWYRENPSTKALLAVAVASNAASLTRYEGWFLIPFVCLVFATGPRKRDAILFAVLASVGPLAWLAHNQYYFQNPLEFFNGPYSAAAIYARQRAAGMAPYPGDHSWALAFQYYFAAMKLNIGTFALFFAAPGAAIAAGRRYGWPLILLALPPAFYLLSMFSGNTPIYMPDLWPHSWYNVRYGLAALPLVAFAGSALIGSLPRHWRSAATALLVIGSTAAAGGAGPLACWKESEVNSVARRAWTNQAASYLAEQYEPGAGIIYSFGDLTGVLRAAGIPLKEGLHEGNHPAWDAAIARPELFLHEEWALAISGDTISKLIARTPASGPHYQLRKRVIVKGAPVIEIYRRQLPPELPTETR